VHAAGIKLDHSFLVGQAAITDAGVVGIVFRALHHAECSVERVAASF